jgi:hypothetical protein
MPTKKTTDPKRLALLDKADKARADYEKWYARMRRAFNRCEKSRLKLTRLQRLLDRPEGGHP